MALTRSGDPPWPPSVRVERSFAYVPALPGEAVPWQWDLLLTGVGTWPYDLWDPSVAEFDLRGFRGARGDVRLALRLVGFTAHTHTVHARINRMAVGSVTFAGDGTALLEARFRPRRSSRAETGSSWTTISYPRAPSRARARSRTFPPPSGSKVGGRVPSENGYADVDGDARPARRRGREPVGRPGRLLPSSR